MGSITLLRCKDMRHSWKIANPLREVLFLVVRTTIANCGANLARSYPGAPGFPNLTTIGIVESRVERGGKIDTERTTLYFLPHTFGAGLRRRRRRPLGHRKQIALDPPM
jgi:hypothetical protein